jgi:cell division protein FtsI/penicillin-binding protein 2
VIAKRTLFTVVAGCGTLSMIVTGCGGDGRVDAEPAAKAVAEALQTGDFSGVPLDEVSADAAADSTAEMIGDDLADVARTVGVQDISRVADDDDRRVVTFDLAWDLDGSGKPGDSDSDWTYTSSTHLSLVDDEWLVEWDPSVVHPDLAADSTFVVRRSQADRATIHGADDEPIVKERTVFRIGIDKANVEGDLDSAATQLAELVDVNVEDFVSRTADTGDKAFVEAITLREADAEDVLEQIDSIDGALAQKDTMLLAPTREFARPILGVVGEATAEIIEEADGTIEQGDVVGLSGIQHQYDDQLRGSPGMTIEIQPADGESQVVLERPAAEGDPVATTLDTDLQLLAERVLADVEPASAIVAVRPSTGGILASASGAGGEGHSTATLGQFAPGSTFKIVTALALLRSGVTPETAVVCSSELDADGKVFTNYSDYPASAVGEITFRSAIANSCNTALIGERDAVTQDDLTDAAASLGLGTGHDAGVAAYLGDVPTDASETGHAASMIGQGEVLASPLAMATVAASVAAGNTVSPYLIAEPSDPAENTLTEDEADTLRDLMFAVVTEGSATFLGDVAGDPVGAKTGTAEYGDDSPLRTHAWMIAIQGDLAVSVFVADGESGSQTAGPLLEEFLSAAG